MIQKLKNDPKDIQLVFTWNEKNNQTLTFNRLIL